MMNPEKARDQFSAYFEDTLDAGLRRAFETRLASDAKLQAEYRAFQKTMEDLDSLKFEEIEVPIFLSDRIATRLETERLKAKPRWNPFAAWTRGLAFASIAAVAIIGTVITLNTKSSGPGTGSVVSQAANELDYVVQNGQVVVKFSPSSHRALVVSVNSVNKTIAPTAPSDVPLTNPNSSATSFRVKLDGDRAATLIVVPGVTVSKVRSGSGNVEDFAKSLADAFHVPVRVDAANAEARLNWNLEGSDAQKAATTALEGLGYTADSRSGGLICILDR